IRNLARFRQKSEALQSGKLMQYVPQDGIYVYFRYTGQAAGTVMVIVNSNDSGKELDTARFGERMQGLTYGKDIQTGKEQPVA
ncbi:cyclomaltodextrinase C-terminal domain-containing protein, partial [Klebsiella pneumoniae]|nr:cyclomaltodextrinase C-terminal domain-containing protein [Klebsiella pneumoniae]